MKMMEIQMKKMKQTKMNCAGESKNESQNESFCFCESDADVCATHASASASASNALPVYFLMIQG